MPYHETKLCTHIHNYLLPLCIGEEADLLLLQKFPGRNGKTINITKSIVDYSTFGIALLNDGTGTIVSGIARTEKGNVPEIIREILKIWITGDGIPDRTWGGLLSVLRSPCNLNALADRIEAVVGY